MPKGFVTTEEAAAKNDMTVRRVQQLCKAGKVRGAQQFAGAWMVPTGFKWKPQKPGPKPKV